MCVLADLFLGLFYLLFLEGGQCCEVITQLFKPVISLSRILLVTAVAISHVVTEGHGLLHYFFEGLSEDTCGDLVPNLSILFLSCLRLCLVSFTLGHANLVRRPRLLF